MDGMTPESSQLQAALRVSVVSLVWTVVSSTAAVTIGIVENSLVLVAFGLTGALDSAGSAVLALHFRHALHHEAFSARHERLALRVVTIGLMVVGTLTTLESVRRLVTSVHAEPVVAGVALAAVSAIVLALLSSRKRRVARAVDSRALLADGWLSATGALLGVVTVVGTGLTSAFDWWWVDPIAAAVVACGAVVAGVLLSKEAA
jgi:divalent metal cation (Fe/Co/Zn/Cd) transporter